MKYTVEIKTLTCRAYRDDAGRPCCAADFNTGEVCMFHRYTSMGQGDACGITMDKLFRRGEAGLGALIPNTTCPLWPDYRCNE